MRNVRGLGIALLCAVLLTLGLSGCIDNKNNRVNADIDWVDFVKWNDITYYSSTITGPSKEISTDAVGAEIGEVRFNVNSNVHNTGYKTKNGDAAYLPKGTVLHEVKGYSRKFRITAKRDGKWVLFEVDTVPGAKKGSDLLDIDGKVDYIGINSEIDGKTELGAIRDGNQVSKLVRLILNAPVVKKDNIDPGKRVFLAFHLKDGTVTQRVYVLDSNLLHRNIRLPNSFTEVINNALQPKQDGNPAEGDDSADRRGDVQKTASMALSYLQEEQWEKLSSLIHPDQGVRFSPYGHIDVNKDLTFTADQIKQWGTDNQTYTWGVYDGSGEPITLTISGYFKKFVTDHRYEEAPKKAVNQIIGKGNIINNLTEVYKEASFIEYHFPGFDAKFEGNDWASLRLVFEKSDGRLYLVGVIHDQWMI